MSGKQMKKLRRAMRAAGAATTNNEHFVVGRERTVVMTKERWDKEVKNIMKILDFNERTNRLRALPPVGSNVKFIADKHIICDEKRRMYKEYKKVLREKNKGGGHGYEAVRGDIGRNQTSHPMGTIPSQKEREGFSGQNGSHGSSTEAPMGE